MFKKTLGWLVVIAVLMLVPMGESWAGSQRDAVCQGSCGGGCGPCPTGGNSGGGYNSGGSSYDYEAERRAQEQAEAARRAEQERQAELERQRREADNKRRMEEIERQTKFLEDRDAAASSLRGSTGAGVSASGGLRGSTATSGGSVLRGGSADTGLRGSKSNTTQAPNLDPMVVDARKVPSGLPKSVENAIAAAYSSAPPGVSDRVRKGFQAVMTRDWKVAKAWFQDALNRDPNNAGLKSLIALTDSLQQPGKQPAAVDARNEPAGLGGRSDVKKASVPPNKTKPAIAGERALSEKMFEDGLQFLNMGDYEHAEQMFRQADFQRNFDAGKPSSPGATTKKTPSKTGKKK